MRRLGKGDFQFMETYKIFELITKLRNTFKGLKNRSALDIMKFALEKQIPQEVQWCGDGWQCPVCKVCRKEKFSHCVSCGQALKRKEDNIELPEEE